MKRVISYLLTFALVLAAGMGYHSGSVHAASAITGNNTMETAYVWGSWSSKPSLGTAILNEGEKESWFKITVAPGERIFVSATSDKTYVGMSVQVKNGLGINEGLDRKNPDNLIDHTGVTPALYVDIDNNSTSTKTYYVVVSRGDTFENAMYFNLSAGNRIRAGRGTFSFSGTASNPGNNPVNVNGTESTVLSLNLTDNTAIPNGAIVTSVSTSSTQSPSQGNVRHMVNPSITSVWYTSIVSNATSGSYNIKLDNGILAKQTWKFKFNAMAGAKSTMSNVKITLNWEYDMKNTQYKIFLN